MPGRPLGTPPRFSKSLRVCSTYEQGVTRYKWGTSDILYVWDPAIIHEMLVDKADAFSRDEVTHRAFTPVIGRTSLFLAEISSPRSGRRAIELVR